MWKYIKNKFTYWRDCLMVKTFALPLLRLIAGHSGMKMLGVGLIMAVLMAGMAQAATVAPKLTYKLSNMTFMGGVNISGGEYNPGKTRHGFDYIYPTTKQIDYYKLKGAKVIRVPFRAKRLVEMDATGKRVQVKAAEMALLSKIIDYAATQQMYVLLDMHDYGMDFENKLIGRDAGSAEKFAASWGALAMQLKGKPNVLFGLMNEPNKQKAAEWLVGVNKALYAIRKSGAMNAVLVSGSYWDGAHSWTKTDNGKVMLGVVDPKDNFAFEVHQYLDANSSGTTPVAVKDAGAKRLVAVTAWAKQNKKKLFLGEFGWADNVQGHVEGRNLLEHMSANRDVWLGFIYWAGGAWWGTYAFSVEPDKAGKDKPQMKVLEGYMK